MNARQIIKEQAFVNTISRVMIRQFVNLLWLNKLVSFYNRDIFRLLKPINCILATRKRTYFFKAIHLENDKHLQNLRLPWQHYS